MDAAAKSAYAKVWYAKNRERVLPLARARIAKAHSLNLRFRKLVLSAQPCKDCEEPPDPDTPFEFDHRAGIGAKAQRRMSDLITKGSSHVRMLKEMALCDIVCPTCHKKRTYDRLQWKRA
jgi:hypothetical protein